MKLLKLAGIDSYVSPLTKLTRVVKGEVIAVDDATAEYMLQGVERRYDMDLPHWEVVSDDTAPTYSFTAEVTIPETPFVAPTVIHAPEPEAEQTDKPEPQAAADATETTDAVVFPPSDPEAPAKPATQRVVRNR
jgi:hypothetical protein